MKKKIRTASLKQNLLVLIKKECNAATEYLTEETLTLFIRPLKGFQRKTIRSFFSRQLPMHLADRYIPAQS